MPIKNMTKFALKNRVEELAAIAGRISIEDLRTIIVLKALSDAAMMYADTREDGVFDRAWKRVDNQTEVAIPDLGVALDMIDDQLARPDFEITAKEYKDAGIDLTTVFTAESKTTVMNVVVCKVNMDVYDGVRKAS